jgi:exosome complex exonuclease RRP6
MNNYLFQLAERPPADMAAFLAVFKSIPPVIRRRAKKVFDLIQETVKEYRGRDNDAVEIGGLDIVITSDDVQDKPVEQVEVTAFTSTNTMDSRLWSKGAYLSR